MASLRHRIPFSIILFDIDLFKSVNDEHGHLVGDEVIRSTANVVRNTLRRTDMLARYGGEEFTVYLPHTDRSQAEMLAQRIRLAVERNAIDTGQADRAIHVTISIGLLSIEEPPEKQVEDPEAYVRELFARADAALYQAKEDGRNRIVYS